MARIVRSQSCGNSPKNGLAEELTVLFADASPQSTDELRAKLAEDATWQPVGKQSIHGADEILAALAKQKPLQLLVIEQVMTHGRSGAINGRLRRADANFGFCYVLEFSSAKATLIQSITTYTIKLP